jgi:ubiquinone/menaquinone biosynthesis C-methylase UbiE
MSNYQTFAKFYDVAMGDQSGKVGFLQDLIAAHASEAKSVLELACGTGTMLEGLFLGLIYLPRWPV